ncbi:hypothetical protein JHK87_006314 [Glycine soja]|nr:hypothetical protein JHK87_006314 [Glycine soja]
MAGPEVAIRSLNSNDTRGKTITCKATVAYGPRGPFVVERVLVHPPQKMETNNNVGSRLDITRILKKKLVTVVLGPVRDSLSVRIRRPLALTAEFPSFMGILKNEAQRAYPRIFGREASGIVESVREGANDMKEGNLVVPIFNGECGDCKYCKCEKTNMCERFGVDPMRKVMVPQGFLQLMENQSCIS